MGMSQQNHVFLDPEDCGSSVGYFVHVDEYPGGKPEKTTYSLHATVVLSDCSRKVDWSFMSGKLDKIDAAISMLQEFRKKYAETDKLVAKLNK